MNNIRTNNANNLMMKLVVEAVTDWTQEEFAESHTVLNRNIYVGDRRHIGDRKEELLSTM